MTDQLGYEPHASEGRGAGNSRNGHYPKTVTTEIGEVELRVPRDRNASFDPKTVRKGQRRLDGLTGNIISLYAEGLTTGDIQAHLAEIYGTNATSFGMWVGPSGGEGAKYWLTLLTELSNRGVADCFIVCCDGLKGLPDAIRAT